MAVYQPRSASKQASTDNDDAASVRSELAREQERLRKLWDAFKSQEDELNRLRATPTTLPAATGDARTSAASQREVDLLTGDLRRAAESQRQLEDQLRQMTEDNRAQAEVARRVPQLEGELEQERERLAKLYAVYEEVEEARKALDARIKEWEAWYHGVAPHLAEICRSIGGAPR